MGISSHQATKEWNKPIIFHSKDYNLLSIKIILTQANPPNHIYTRKEGFTILLLAGNCCTDEENLIQLFLLLRFSFALSPKCQSFQMQCDNLEHFTVNTKMAFKNNYRTIKKEMKRSK